MITEEDYLKAKQIVQEYEKQLNISDVMFSIGDRVYRENVLGREIGVIEKIKDDKMILNECGKIVKQQWQWLADQYDLDQFLCFGFQI